MYEILLKWGLDSLTKSMLKLDDDQKKHSLSIAMEAIKSKNEMVQTQIGWTHDICCKLVDLSLEVSERINDYEKSEEFEVASYKNVKTYLYEELNADFYWKVRKLRSRFEMSNDLLAGYSHVSSKKLLNQNTLSSIFKKSGNSSKSRVLKTYKNIWLYIAELHCALLRISCNTPMFFLGELGYNKKAEDLAFYEIEQYIDYLKDGDDFEYGFLLEEPRNIDAFFSEDELNISKFVSTYPYP